MKNTRNLTRVACALGVALTMSACGPGAPPPPPFDGDTSKVLTISIENQQLEEARVWLWVAGLRVPMGSVRANQTVTFHHPMPGMRAVHMEFQVTLGPRCVTDDVTLGPGDNIRTEIPQSLVAFIGVCDGE